MRLRVLDLNAIRMRPPPVRYLDAALAMAGADADWPVVLAHDGEDPARAAEIARR